MREGKFLASEENVQELAVRKKNYTGFCVLPRQISSMASGGSTAALTGWQTGAEIEAVVKGATSFALYREKDLKKVGRQQTVLKGLGSSWIL